MKCNFFYHNILLIRMSLGFIKNADSKILIKYSRIMYLKDFLGGITSKKGIHASRRWFHLFKGEER
jgi:hypothetical protein